jgi:chromosome segregation ATPase
MQVNAEPTRQSCIGDQSYEEEEMESIATQLKDLQEALKKCEEEIANTQGTLQEAQKKIGEANRRRSELQGELNEMQANQSAIENERKAVDSEIKDAEKAIAEVTAQLKDKIPEGRTKAIEDAVKSVDDDIGRRNKALNDVRDKLTAAARALTDAQSQAAVDEQEVGNIKGRLKSLPNQSKTARSRVSDLKSTIRSMAKSGQINDALYAMGELNRAMDELAKLIDAKQEEELVKQLLDQQQKTTAGKDDVAQKTATCEQLRRDVAAVDGEYQNAVKMREAAIKAKLAALPAKEEPGTAAGGNPASKPEEQPAESSR